MKIFLMMFIGAVAAVGILTGCATQNSEESANALLKFKEGAKKAKTIEPSGNPPIDAVGQTTTILYKRTADNILNYIYAMEGEESVVEFNNWYRGQNSEPTEDAQKAYAKTICFETDCTDAAILEKHRSAKAISDAERLKVEEAWYGAGNQDSSNALVAEAAALRKVADYEQYSTDLKKCKDDKAKKEFLDKFNADAERKARVEEGKKIFDQRMAVKEPGFSLEKKLEELGKMAEEAGQVLVDLTNAVNKDPSAVVINPFGSAEEKAKATRVKDTVGAIGDQGKYSVEGLKWMISKYMDLREANKESNLKD
jgi:hypothetical protein